MTKQKSHKELLPIIDKVKRKVADSDAYKKLCAEHKVNEDIIFLVPMAFIDLDVSARTEKGCIYFNYNLLKDGGFEDNEHYGIHEFTHFLQQCLGDEPTTMSPDEDYLDNENEQEGFQVQTEFLSETEGDDVADKYIEKVLDHHDVDETKERKEKKDELLNLAINWLSDKKQAKKL